MNRHSARGRTRTFVDADALAEDAVAADELKANFAISDLVVRL